MNQKLKHALGLDRPKLLLSMICCGLAVHLAFPRYLVATGSMVPTMPPGSYVVSCRTALLPGPIKKGDAVIFKPVSGISPKPWVHRIIEVAREQFTPPKRHGRKDVSANRVAQNAADTTGPLVVPQSFFYQSGDSDDSCHGLVPEELITAKVLFHFKLPWR